MRGAADEALDRAVAPCGDGALDVSHAARPRCRGLLDTAGVAMIGYARVSTSDQNPEVQATRLREQGYLWVFADRAVSGKLASRPQLDACRACAPATYWS